MTMDKMATRQAIRADGRTVSGYARHIGVDPTRFYSVMYGKAAVNDVEAVALKRDGYFREVIK